MIRDNDRERSFPETMRQITSRSHPLQVPIRE